MDEKFDEHKVALKVFKNYLKSRSSKQFDIWLNEMISLKIEAEASSKIGNRYIPKKTMTKLTSKKK